MLAEPRTVGRARRAVRAALEQAGAAHLRERAELVVSELVTNAVVHAGTQVRLRITAERAALRVEVEDRSVHLPVVRHRAATAGTGRGLVLVEEHADRWDAARTDDGKIVWFEIGDPTDVIIPRPPTARPSPGAVDIVLRRVPLVMHWAWQEHAATLLREYLLYSLEDDDAIGDHAAASTALSVLNEQLPTPDLPADPNAVLASSVEPAVTADEVILSVPSSSVRHFEVLDDLLRRARAAASDGQLLSPPIQPEMAEMRAWLCSQVISQAAHAEPIAWQPGSHKPRRPNGDHEAAQRYDSLVDAGAPVLVTNDACVIVAVSPSLLQFLGYRTEADLLGQRILVVVPTRYQQAHIAGITLHATNGRDVLLNQWVRVPVRRADGHEAPVDLFIRTRRLDGSQHVFVAEFRPLRSELP